MRITLSGIRTFSFIMMMYMLSLFNYSESGMLKAGANLSVLLFMAVMFLPEKKKLCIPSAAGHTAVGLLFSALSIIVSTSKDDSLDKFITLLMLFFLFAAVYMYASAGNMDFVLKVIGSSAAATALYIAVKGLPILQTAKRVNRIAGDSNQVSAYLVYGIAVLLYLLMLKKLPAWFSLSGIGVSILAIVLQGSRTSIAVAGILIVLETAALMKRENVRMSKRIAALLLLAVLLISAAYYIMTDPVMYMTLGRRLVSFYELSTGLQSSINEQSMSKRALAYSLAWERFTENPLLGRGIGSFSEFSKGTSLARAGFCPNNYLELLQGIGLLGTIAYYMPYMHVLFSSAGKKSMDKGSLPVLMAVLVLSMLAEHITVVFYYHKLEYIYLAVLLAAVTGLGRASENSPEKKRGYYEDRNTYISQI